VTNIAHFLRCRRLSVDDCRTRSHPAIPALKRKPQPGAIGPTVPITGPVASYQENRSETLFLRLTKITLHFVH
jgi:hypothetical protein